MKFYISILERIKARRHATHIDLMLYLNNPDFISSSNHFQISSKSSIKKLGIELLQKYIHNAVPEPSPNISNESSLNIPSSSLKDRLHQSLLHYASNSNEPGQMNENLNREFSWFDRNKKRSTLLEQLFSALCSIQPTSTQSERNFSISNNILSKQRKKMLDKNINAIVFLKSFFMEEK